MKTGAITPTILHQTATAQLAASIPHGEGDDSPPNCSLHSPINATPTHLTPHTTMTYGRLEKPAESSHPPPPSQPTAPSRRRRFLLLGLAIVFLLVSIVSAAFVIFSHTPHGHFPAKPTQAISSTCGLTLYPALCITSLLDFPGALSAGQHDLVHISLNMTLHHVSRALYASSTISNVAMDKLTRSAYDDCMELLDDSVDHLSNSLLSTATATNDDVITWLSAALTNQDTCNEGLGTVSNTYVTTEMSSNLKDLTEIVSNCLAIFCAVGGTGSGTGSSDFAGVPIQNKRRLMSEFPDWVARTDRHLLQAPTEAVQADIVVGSGGYRTIGEAVKAAPEYSKRRIVIYVKAGTYEENVKVGKKKKNLMFMGDGKGKTVVTGWRSIGDYTTFHTATFAATGAHFIMRDMTIQNTAGPAKHQAVALRVGADHSVVYRCSIIGYQDTLYVHSQRQFIRECDIYGTVDFIFGNAAVVIQHSTIWARKPLPLQKNTVTAQNRKDPNQNTGISIHACKIVATPELEPVKWSYPTFLGRPWKMYSRVVYMLNYIGDNVDPAGWLAWNATFALDTLYYGEYMNYGPGSAVGKRVTWPGYRVITLPEEANKFTVGEFISGSSWLPSTGVAFLAGLQV